MSKQRRKSYDLMLCWVVDGLQAELNCIIFLYYVDVVLQIVCVELEKQRANLRQRERRRSWLQPSSTSLFHVCMCVCNFGY